MLHAGPALLSTLVLIITLVTLVAPASGHWPAKKTGPNVTEIAFAHVGKTGGTSIRQELKMLLPIQSFSVHVRRLERDDLLNRTGLFAARDPTDRLVSAFNWRHPTGGGDTHRQSDKSHVRKKLLAEYEAQKATLPQGHARHAIAAEIALYECFDTVQEFAAGLIENPPTRCGLAARRMLEGEFQHVGMGLAFYFGGVLQLLPELRYALIDTATLQDDMSCFMTHMQHPGTSSRGGTSPGKSNKPTAQVPHKNSNYALHNTTSLDDATRLALRSVLAKEYHVLGELRRHAKFCRRKWQQSNS